MAIPIRIAVSPSVPRTERRLTLYGEQLADWPVFWAEVAIAFAQAEQEWFESQGEGTWAPLNPEYAARKAELFPGKTILRATDTLYDSLTDTSQAAHLAGPDAMVFGTTDPVAQYHYDGTPKMPKRNPLISIVKQREIARSLLESHVAYHGFAEAAV